jgi:hypothetical protein
MSTIVRRLALSGLLASGCAAEDDDGMDDTVGADESSTGAVDPTAAATTMTTAPTTMPAEESSSGDGEGDVTSGDPTVSESSGVGEASSEGDADSGGSESGGEVVFDEEFVWVADFLRANCTVCHATNANGNLVLTPADLGNDEVRLALEGIVATTGLMLVQPGDREASQTYLQITNEFGAQFPVEDTDRFGAWIDAGANYFAP